MPPIPGTGTFTPENVVHAAGGIVGAGGAHFNVGPHLS
jgi:hypothetical protein